MKRFWADVLCCPRCRSDLCLEIVTTQDEEVVEGILDCQACNLRLAVVDGVCDLLVDPPAPVQNEVQGQIAQRRGDLPPEVARARAEKYRVLDFDEFRRANLRGALAHVTLHPGMTVLDLGAGDGWLAPEMAARGAHYLGLDVLYPDDVTDLLACGSFLRADLNFPPVKSACFDVVVTSASLHHAYDLSGAIAEVARLLKPGGVFLALSEPTKGLLKDNRRYACDAHPCLNEHVYWVWEYWWLARRAGLQPRTYLPGYVKRRLEAGATRGLRFGELGRLVAYLWRNSLVRVVLDRYAYWPSAVLLGIPMVLVAWKPDPERKCSN